MKNLIALAVASAVTAALAAGAAEARNKKGDFIQNTPEGMKVYTKTCVVGGACGNWNVKG